MWNILGRNLLLFLCLCIYGCARVGIDRVPGAERSAEQPTGKLDFGWRLSGDRTVAPLQIFSDSTRTWLQWSPQQTLPALIGQDQQGERVLSYRQQGPYTVVDGQWMQLQFRAGTRQARARRVHALSSEVSTPSSKADAPQTQTQTQTQVQVPPVTVKSTEKLLNASAVAPSVLYVVTLKDIHLRQALGRWASLAGWKFQPDHWVVDVDIPLTADAVFNDDFIESVRALVGSTELSDRPLQPCFYSNQVMRIVPLSEHCDRTVEQGASV
jgi:hypothetical protein